MAKRIEIHYLTADGSYRKGLGIPDGVLLRNQRDSQLHTLRHSPVFPIGEPLVFDSWEAFEAAEEPEPDFDSKNLMAIYPWDSHFALPQQGLYPFGEVVAQSSALYEQAFQKNAVGKATKSDQAMAKLAFMVVAGMIVLFSLIFGVMLLNIMFGGE